MLFFVFIALVLPIDAQNATSVHQRRGLSTSLNSSAISNTTSLAILSIWMDSLASIATDQTMTVALNATSITVSHHRCTRTRVRPRRSSSSSSSDVVTAMSSTTIITTEMRTMAVTVCPLQPAFPIKPSTPEVFNAMSQSLAILPAKSLVKRNT